MNMKLYPLSVALSASAVLMDFADSEVPFSYDAFLSAVSGVEFDPIEMDSAECCDAQKALVSFVSFLGVPDNVIEDMVSGRENISTDSITSLAKAFKEKYSEEDTHSLAEEFSGTYNDDTITMDGVSPKRCKSGYKRKMVVRDGKPTWVCKRLFGRTRLSSKQKQALRKARNKAHSSMANYSRKRSMKIGEKRGLHS